MCTPQLESLAGFSAVVDRLGQFREVMDSYKPNEEEDTGPKVILEDKPSTSSTEDPLLILDQLTLETPDAKSTLIQNLSLQV